ncbi:MAG: molecular chaperone HtpG [Candidatus Kapabacteria bacterium]|nr:molecular chaperone HtpG [Candidatus Kapabacteria bacterium]
MAEMNANANKFEFKAEMKQLLHLIIHSLYTNPEVFIRELVSNASDALNKVRFRLQSEEAVYSPESELNIKITLDKENNLFSIEDTGDGMSHDDLVGRLGTIASSGTLKFLEQMKESKQAIDSNMIGQFGVGFYSVFMVTDEATVESRSSALDGKAYIWQSDGQSTFTVSEGTRTERGTKISFKLKDEYKQYLEDYTVKGILKKYSNFVDFPLSVNGEVVNTVSALWHKKKDDVKPEELTEFYKFITNDFEAPLGHLQLNIEGNVNFKALLFIPATAPNTLFKDVAEKSVQLYSSKVFIQDDCKELLPDYLKFVRGVVDTEDLPLNVSREVVQSSPVMSKIKNVLTSKLLGLFDEWAQKDKEKYDKFFKNFGSLFKTGVTSDYTNKDKILELLRFESSAQPKGETTSLCAYAGRMKPDQKEIFYLLGERRDTIEENPKLEYYRKHDLEVLYLTDTVDYFTIPYIFEYDKKPLISIEKAEIKADDAEVSAEAKEISVDIIKSFKDILGDKVEDVRVSNRLVESPVTLVAGANSLDPQMEKMMQVFDKNFAKTKQILEVNMEHPLIKNLHNMMQSGKNVSEYVGQLYDGALLLEGSLNSPADYVKRMTEIMLEATKK